MRSTMRTISKNLDDRARAASKRYYKKMASAGGKVGKKSKASKAAKVASLRKHLAKAFKPKGTTPSDRARINKLASSKAKMPAWFKKLSPAAKLAYIKAHPNSKLGRVGLPTVKDAEKRMYAMRNRKPIRKNTGRKATKPRKKK